MHQDGLTPNRSERQNCLVAEVTFHYVEVLWRSPKPAGKLRQQWWSLAPILDDRLDFSAGLLVLLVMLRTRSCAALRAACGFRTWYWRDRTQKRVYWFSANATGALDRIVRGYRHCYHHLKRICAIFIIAEVVTSGEI